MKAASHGPPGASRLMRASRSGLRKEEQRVTTSAGPGSVGSSPTSPGAGPCRLLLHQLPRVGRVRGLPVPGSHSCLPLQGTSFINAWLTRGSWSPEEGLGVMEG